MTLLEFCKSYFPDEEIFSEQNGTILVNTRRLLEMEYERLDRNPAVNSVVKPSDVLSCVEPGDWYYYNPSPGARDCNYGMEPLALSEESAQSMKQFRLVIDPEVAGIDLDARRAYFRMRGRPVTEEQAFDIIRRTDYFFTISSAMREYHLKDLVDGTILFSEIFHPSGLWQETWVRPNGVIGTNDVTWKYPDAEELVCYTLPLLLAFPYLDLIIGVTNWNEAPPYAWDAFREDDEVFSREDYPDFEENIVCGLWIHDGALELMAPARAQEKYAEYRRLYGGPNEDIFKHLYYMDKDICLADFDYLKRCIRSHGLDPEEVLACYKWDPARGLRYRSEPGAGGACSVGKTPG